VNEINLVITGLVDKGRSNPATAVADDPAAIVPIPPYNPRSSDDPRDIEYRAEDSIEEHSEDIQLKQSISDETYNHRTGVERTNDAVKDCDFGHHPRPRLFHARTAAFPTPCPRPVVPITNFERGDDPGREKLKV